MLTEISFDPDDTVPATLGSTDDEVRQAYQLCQEYYGDCERAGYANKQPARRVDKYKIFPK